MYVWLTLEVAGCGDIEPISDPIAPQSFGLSLAPARNNDVIVRTPNRLTIVGTIVFITILFIVITFSEFPTSVRTAP